MTLLDRLEQKFGRYAIRNLSVYILMIYAFGYVFYLIAPEICSQYFTLDVALILKGQVWRLLSFILLPTTTSPFRLLLMLYLYYFIGTGLERTWGSFRFNLFYFSGVLFQIIGAFLAYLISYLTLGVGISFHMGISYLNLSMFLAFAALYPDMQLLLFFVIPIKMKWLGWINAAYFGYTIIVGILPSFNDATGGVADRMELALAISALCSLMNFFIFYLQSRKGKRSDRSRAQNWKMAYETGKRQKARAAQTRTNEMQYGGAKHRCTICGRTELTNPELEFRYCSKCHGAHEYCQEHLFTHTHIQP